ncbi:MAG: class C sortase [Firmicutes bacterium]|nr:class C sortase [Bacillota bacterium]
MKKKNRRSSWLARNLVTILLAMIFIVGAGLLLYPSFSNWWNSTRQSKVLEQYISEIEMIDTSLAEAQIASALEYNHNMLSKGIMWAMSEEEKILYDAELNSGDTGVMGFVEINSIDVKLPIYHGVDESTLARGIGHIEGTSLPVGAKSFDDDKGEVMDPQDGSHCVISGHRGLPSSRLFTDLDKLQVGDAFALNIYNTVLIYEVDQIRIVEPADLSELQLVRGEDYCTMVTCTPYGINTHRLLVRGRRVSTQDAERYIYRIQSNANQIKPAIVAPVMAAPVLLAMFIAVMLDPRRKLKKQEQKEKEEDMGIELNLELADLSIERLDLSQIDVEAFLKKGKSVVKKTKNQTKR